MLMNLLPGLRELRAPLVSGYLWLISAWLVLGRIDWLPTQRPIGDGEVARLWDLGGELGRTAVLAAVTFIAYLVGSFLETDPDGRLAAALKPVVLADRRPWYSRSRTDGDIREAANLEPYQPTDIALHSGRTVAQSISSQARDDMIRVFEYRHMIPDPFEPVERPVGLLMVRPPEDEFTKRNLIAQMKADRIISDMIREMPQLASRLLVKNKDLYGKYDRQMAEASLRINVSVPLTMLLVLVAWLSALPIWLRLALTLPILAFGFMLMRQGFLRAVSARDVIAQALIIDEVQSRYLPAEASTEGSADASAGSREPTGEQRPNPHEIVRPKRRD
jgi:hypothetical protein